MPTPEMRLFLLERIGRTRKVTWKVAKCSLFFSMSVRAFLTGVNPVLWVGQSATLCLECQEHTQHLEPKESVVAGI